MEPRTLQPQAQTPITLALLNKNSLAARLGLSVRTVDNLVAARELPHGVRVGRYLYWTEGAVATWQANLFAKQLAWTPKERIKR